MTYFYKLKGNLNNEFLELEKGKSKLSIFRNKFLKSKGLLEEGMSYYQFYDKIKLTDSQTEKLDIPKKELKQDGTPRKNSKTMKDLQKEYINYLKSNDVDLSLDYNSLGFMYMDLIGVFGTRISYQHFNHNDTVYFSSSEKVQNNNKDIIEINGSEFYKVLEELK